MGMGHEPSLPFASSLCGACAEVCPVKIDIPKVLLDLRVGREEGRGARRPRPAGAAGVQDVGVGDVPSADLRDGSQSGRQCCARGERPVAAARAVHIQSATGGRVAQPAGPATVAGQKLPRDVEEALSVSRAYPAQGAHGVGTHRRVSRARSAACPDPGCRNGYGDTNHEHAGACRSAGGKNVSRGHP